MLVVRNRRFRGLILHGVLGAQAAQQEVLAKWSEDTESQKPRKRSVVFMDTVKCADLCVLTYVGVLLKEVEVALFPPPLIGYPPASETKSKKTPNNLLCE